MTIQLKVCPRCYLELSENNNETCILSFPDEQHVKCERHGLMTLEEDEKWGTMAFAKLSALL